MDPFEEMKAKAKESWAAFVPMEMLTGTAAPKLVRFAGVRAGARVLDVACGTGVVALTAARLGAHVTGLDLTPPLLERAKQHATLLGVETEFTEGDVEAMPFPGASFDFVLSQFGHMFAPRPTVAVSEMLRVLKPGGTIAFSTWPPELYTGQFLALMARFAPPPSSEGAAPPPLWGNPEVVRERLGDAVRDLVFDRDRIRVPILSPQHLWAAMSGGVGPGANAVKALEGRPERIQELGREVIALSSTYFEDNAIRQDFLMTRAIKR